MRIVILGDKLNTEEKTNIDGIEIIEVEAATSVNDFLAKTEGADAIYDADTEYLLDSLPKLKNVYVTLSIYWTW